MCGIAGAIAIDGRAPVPAELVNAMCDLIVHRGPDDVGLHTRESASIGMRRLSIIDLAGGHQPIHNEDKTVWLVFNGEIYNYAELRRDLQRAGHAFYTNSDSECIVHAYEEYGLRCFEKLRGMFAIAIWDEPKKCLVVARDRLGKKPLYYTTSGGLFSFASELKCFLALPGFDRTLDESAVWNFALLGYVPGPSSAFRAVKKLPPGSYAVVQDGRISIEKYWQLSYGPKLELSESEAVSAVLAKLEESVRIRLVSDVPFGAFLSGGLDSSIVAALMARNLGTRLKTFTIGFRESEFDESADARRIASALGTEHHELFVDVSDASVLPKLAWHLDEPFADSSAIPTFYVSRLAAQTVKMVHSGDGGDELFAGYTRYRKFKWLERARRYSAGSAGSFVAAAAGLAGPARRDRLRRLAERLDSRYPELYIRGVALASPELALTILSDRYRSETRFASIAAHYASDSDGSDIDAILGGDTSTYLLDDILVKVDRMSMANSLEARAPLLDHELVELVARLPTRLKPTGKAGKLILRRIAAQLLPAEVLSKRKKGFSIPLAAWFRGHLGAMLQDSLASRQFRERGVFRAERVRELLQLHQSGTANYSETLWQVLCFEMWAQQFLDQPLRTRPAVERGSAAVA